MDAPYTSNLLHHFVGARSPDNHSRNWETLNKVLNGRCVSHPPHLPGAGTTGYKFDPAGWLFKETLLVPTVTCYADIPVESLRLHVSKYGKFGLSFSRKLLIEQGARPVTYVPVMGRTLSSWVHTGQDLLDDIEAVYRGFKEFCGTRLEGQSKFSRTLLHKPETEAEVLSAMKAVFELHMLAFIKPFNSDLPPDHPDCYYMEREWRKHGNLMFDLADVCTVWVARGYHDKVAKLYPQLADRVNEI